MIKTKKAVDSDWNDLKIFLAVARGGTQASAAEVLGQSPPTVGRRIRALERSLGSALFRRSADGLSLTHEGTAVLRHVEQMEIESMAVWRRLAGHSELAGLLRVSASGWLGSHLLAPVFAAFSHHHPQLQIKLLSDRGAEGLVRHEVDLIYQLGRFDQADLVQRALMRVDYALYGQAGNPAQRVPVPAGGQGHKLVSLAGAAGDPGHDAWLATHFGDARTTLRTDNPEALLLWCRSGVGLAVLPREVGAQCPDLLEIAAPAQPPGRTVWAAFHHDLADSPRLHALLEATLQRAPT